jgi:hypothetical protein
MAYSEEALDNLGYALFYLHDYYRFTSDDKVLKKMQELAQINALNGYDKSEYEKFKGVLKDNQLTLVFILISLAFVILIMIWRKYQKHHEKSPGLTTSFILCLCLSAYILNFTDELRSGILMRNDILIMSGPSAAAELIEVVDQGHKVNITGQKDVWVEILWKGQKAFIRENNIEELL